MEHTFYKTMESEISGDSNLIHIICEAFNLSQHQLTPDYLDLKSIMDINDFIAQQKSSQRNNIYIAERLAGGRRAVVRHSGVEPQLYEEYFRTHDYKALSQLFVTHFDFDTAFFEFGRTYYNRDQITLFRSKNLSYAMRYVTDIVALTSCIDSLEAFESLVRLSPAEYNQAINDSIASLTVRQIESALGLTNGSLDMRHSQFVQYFDSALS
ncbi:hypothetical protein [Vibrio agarivorans]|uniref:hypothetical protein n=1 Tax=Vibrio agarivorans TaxID=153622 RepID=UPI0025B3A968|nr:hypothetical protein [Vibrio agarivorans]MDN3661076.1 hypothetical protein [Vibrio agarivorans]